MFSEKTSFSQLQVLNVFFIWGLQSQPPRHCFKADAEVISRTFPRSRLISRQNLEYSQDIMPRTFFESLAPNKKKRPQGPELRTPTPLSSKSFLLLHLCENSERCWGRVCGELAGRTHTAAPHSWRSRAQHTPGSSNIHAHPRFQWGDRGQER